MANGIIIINKEKDWTSHDVVAKLRGILKTRRVGHGGTLDPMAEGVLPVFIGRATRGAEFFSSADKEYMARFRLGITTDTQDITGRVLEERPVSVSESDVKRALEGFRGSVKQIPPMYSAVKKEGKKLYELARKGLEVEREPRDITIFELEYTGAFGGDYEIRVVCSKGTYIRTLCHDIGQALGCGAAMTSLTRTRAGAFCIGSAVTLELVQKYADEGRAGELIRPVDEMFRAYPAFMTDSGQERLCRNGTEFKAEAPAGLCRVYSQKGEFLMLGEARDGAIKTVRSFFEV